jgi:hypothetical protein
MKEDQGRDRLFDEISEVQRRPRHVFAPPLLPANTNSRRPRKWDTPHHRHAQFIPERLLLGAAAASELRHGLVRVPAECQPNVARFRDRGARKAVLPVGAKAQGINLGARHEPPVQRRYGRVAYTNSQRSETNYSFYIT